MAEKLSIEGLDVSQRGMVLIKMLDSAIEYGITTPSKFADLCFAMCVKNWNKGKNAQALSIDKFVVSDSEVWTQICQTMGISVGVATEERPCLPRVQQERVILDALCVSIFSSEDENVKTAIQEMGTFDVFFCIDSSGYFFRRLSPYSGVHYSCLDKSEADLKENFELVINILNRLGGFSDEEEKEEEEEPDEEPTPDEELIKFIKYYEEKTNKSWQNTELLKAKQDEAYSQVYVVLFKELVETWSMFYYMMIAGAVQSENFQKVLVRMPDEARQQIATQHELNRVASLAFSMKANADLSGAHNLVRIMCREKNWWR